MSNPDGVINIGADGRAFFSAVKAMEKNTDTMANSISARLARLGQAFQGLASAGNVASGAVSAFTGPAAAVEDVGTALAVMMGDNTEAAMKLADSLQMMAANGVVGMDDLSGAARALTNVYKDSGHIEHWVSVFANIAAGSKLPATRLAEMAARLNDLGKAEFTELANAGVPIFEALAEVTGKSKEEIIRLQSVVGGIGLGEYLAALQRLTEEGARYHQVNSALSNTTKGSFETLQASIAACAGELGKPINDALRPVMQELAAELQELKPKIAGVAGSFGGVMQAGVAALRPVIDAAAWMAEKFTKTDKVIGYAAAGLLVYAGYANRAAAATFSFSGALAGTVTRLKALNLTAVFSGWGGVLGVAKRSWAGMCGFMTTTWRSMCITLSVTFKAACVAIKAALISSGIGAIVWALGEGFAALYQWFAGIDEEAQAAAASARQFGRVLRDLKVSAADVKSAADAMRVEEQTQEKIKALGDEIADAIAEDDERKVAQLRSQRAELQEWLEVAKKQMQIEVARHEKQERARQQMEEQKRLAEETAKAEQDRLKTIRDMNAARQNSDFERSMDRLRAGGGENALEEVIAERLKRAGVGSVEALQAEMKKLEGLAHPTEWQTERYRVLNDVLGKVEEEQNRIDERNAKKTEERTQRRRNYADRRNTYEENRYEEQYARLSVTEQGREIKRRARRAGYFDEVSVEGLRAKLDALADAGAKENEDRIAELERILELHTALVERKEEYARLRATGKQEMRIQAMEALGDKRGADALREQMEVARRVRELQERGYSKDAAEAQAGKESKLRAAQAFRDRVANARVEYVKSSLASVGGGVSRRLGDGQLAEAKKHSGLLKEIRDILNGTKGAYAILS